MKRRTIGILTTSVAVSALCVITDGVRPPERVAGMAEGVGVGADLAVGVGTGWRRRWVAGFAVGVAAGMAEAVDFMGLLPMVAWPPWVMAGVAMH